jgi:hypothetical protein
MDSRCRRSSSSLICSFIFLLAFPPDALRSASGSVDLERRKNPKDALREVASELFVLMRFPFSVMDGRASGGGDLPGVCGLEAVEAMANGLGVAPSYLGSGSY